MQDVARYASFVSSEENQAFVVNNYLCPKGKFGYDPRCRAWYNDAKQKAMDTGNGVHITPPYQFATVTDVGTTAVSPLIDPVTGEFVGTTSSDFETTEMQEILDDATVDAYAVTMPNAPAHANTVAASNMGSGSTPLALEEVFLPNDLPQGTNRENLITIMKRMNEGFTGTAFLKRTNGDGVEEVYHVVYYPMYARELKVIHPDDFSRGANVSDSLLYSVIMTTRETQLLARYHDMADCTEQDLEKFGLMYLVVTGVVTLMCILLTASVSRFILVSVMIMTCLFGVSLLSRPSLDLGSCNQANDSTSRSR
jgi:hypothetical protein